MMRDAEPQIATASSTALLTNVDLPMRVVATASIAALVAVCSRAAAPLNVFYIGGLLPRMAHAFERAFTLLIVANTVFRTAVYCSRP
jgi:hypothetical protein